MGAAPAVVAEGGNDDGESSGLEGQWELALLDGDVYEEADGADHEKSEHDVAPDAHPNLNPSFEGLKYGDASYIFPI